MQKLLEEIRHDAERRLTLPPGADPAQEGERYRKFLKFYTQRLKLLHRSGTGGLALCQARAAVMDVILEHVAAALAEHTDPEAPTGNGSCALVALGGYGRGELNPYSDIDVMILLDGGRKAVKNLPPEAGLFTTGLIWNIVPKVGHFVRTVDDCVRVANTDMESKTALLEARLICGDAKLFDRLQREILQRCVKGHEDAYIQARLQDQAERRTRHGDTPCMQEPNIKNGCGGLRDFQNLLWMTFVKYHNHTLAELVERGLIDARDRTALESGYDFLLRVRNELHYTTNRAEDVLYRQHQPAVAHGLGYSDRSPGRRIEQFMHDYYLQARELYFTTRTLEQRLALLPQPKAVPRLRHFLRQRRHNAAYVLDGFKFVDGETRPASERVFREDPARLMRVFRHAQLRNLQLSPGLFQLIRSELHLADESFRADPHVRASFLELLSQRGSVAPAVRAMHETGLLGHYLPAFDKLTCRVQHDFFHVYTVDEHTINCLEMLDRIAGATTTPFNEYTEMFHRVERPFLLYLALLLHDTGKGRPGRNHAVSGSRIAGSVARRLELDPVAIHILELLIREHLTMIHISQRRDLDDAAELRQLAERVENQTQLEMLTLLTFADSMGTSTRLWNGHKNDLLLTLFRHTERLLTKPVEEELAESTRREQLYAEVCELLGQRPVSGAGSRRLTQEEVTAHLDNLPVRYHELRAPQEVLQDLDLIHQFLERQVDPESHPFEPVTAWRHDQDRAYSELKFCSWDRQYLFARICGALSAVGLNILSAEIFTRTDDIALDTFLVTDAATSAPASTRQQERADAILREALTGEPDLPALIERRRTSWQGPPPIGETIPTSVHFDDYASSERSMLEIETEDRLGLLYTIASTFAELAVNISVAKIVTERGAANDTFYVTEQDGQPVAPGDRQAQIRHRLLEAIKELR